MHKLARNQQRRVLHLQLRHKKVCWIPKPPQPKVAQPLTLTRLPKRQPPLPLLRTLCGLQQTFEPVPVKPFKPKRAKVVRVRKLKPPLRTRLLPNA